MSFISIILPESFLKWIPQPLVITINADPVTANLLAEINRKLDSIMTREEELDAAIADLKTAVTGKLDELLAKIAELKADHPDLADEIDGLTKMAADVRAVTAP